MKQVCEPGICRHGAKYIPSVVRVGLSVHHSVRSVSLDALVEQRMRSAKVPAATTLPPHCSAAQS